MEITDMEKMTNRKPVPEVGQYYHFWDDGKISTSRHYLCKCERIITPKEAKEIAVTVPEWDFNTNENDFVCVSLYDHWEHTEMPQHDWLYDVETDFFVECSCPIYDMDNLWFVRTKDGGWFSMNVQNSWQSGRLDIDGKIYESVIQDIRDHPDMYDTDKAIKAYMGVRYMK